MFSHPSHLVLVFPTRNWVPNNFNTTLVGIRTFLFLSFVIGLCVFPSDYIFNGVLFVFSITQFPVSIELHSSVLFLVPHLCGWSENNIRGRTIRTTGMSRLSVSSDTTVGVFRRRVLSLTPNLPPLTKHQRSLSIGRSDVRNVEREQEVG